MKRANGLICLLVALIITSPAVADVLIDGEDVTFGDFFDYRVYDSSHPRFGLINAVGGWKIGATILNQESVDLVERVEIEIIGGVSDRKTVISSPLYYRFLDSYNWDYTVWMGHKRYVEAERFRITIYDHNDMPMQIQWPGGGMSDAIDLYPETNLLMAPVCQLRKMAITADGRLRVKFTAPYDPNATDIRIRIYSESGEDFDDDFRYYPDSDGHYKIIQKDGDVVMDKMKVFLPIKFAGHIARIEYRVRQNTAHPNNLGSTAWLRSSTFIQLPALEAIVVEEPDVTISVECIDSSGLASVVDGVCTCPDLWIYEEGVGCVQ